MKNTFIHNLGARPNEFFMFLLTCIQAICLGSFLVTFDIGTHILFFESYESSMIPMAFIFSGILGAVYMTFYSLLSNRLAFRSFIFINYLIITAAVSAFVLDDTLMHLEIAGIPLMMPFSLMFPVNIIILLAFWRSVRNIFAPGQSRRMNPYFRAFLFGSMAVVSFILVILFYSEWDRKIMLAVSAGLLVIITCLQAVMNLIHRFSPVFFHPMKKMNPMRSKLIELFYSRYTLLLLLFVILSTTIGFLIHFQFVSMARITYTNLMGFSKFLAFFLGFMFIFGFLIEKFVTRRILYSYDSPYSLALIPAATGIGIIATLLISLLAGPSGSITRFTYGFLMVAVIRIAFHTVRESIEVPSLKVLFRTLDIRFHNIIIPRIEGTFRMAGIAIAGFLLVGLFYLGLDKQLFQNILLLLLTVSWFILAVFLVKAYQRALIEGIRRLKTNVRSVEQELLSTDEKAHSLINNKDPRKVITALSLFERIEPIQHEKHLIGLLGSSSFEIKKHLLEKINEYSVLNALPVLKESSVMKMENSKKAYALAVEIVNRFENKLSIGGSKESLAVLSNSKNINDRILAAEIAGTSGNKEWQDVVMNLSRDIEPEVKSSAVRAMARLNCAEHSHVLIGYLSAPNFFQFAFEALIKIGDPALEYLDQVFLLPDADNVLLSRIIRIYGKVGSPKAIDLLLTKIENQNRYLTRQAIYSLREAKFQTTPANINRILNAIIRLITNIAWNYSVYQQIRKSKKFEIMLDAFESEIEDNYNLLYNLLSLAYNSASISNIRNLLNDGDDTDISFAIEMLDQILNEEIKQVFFPVVENLSIKSRVKQLDYFFHTEKSNPEDLINEIIIRDFNAVSYYTKACAIYSLLNIKHPRISQELVAMVFHPDKLLRESASYIIEKIEPGYLDSVFPRLDISLVNEIRNSLEQSGNTKIPYLLIERIRFLKQAKVFRTLTEDVLLEISKHLDINYLNGDDQLLIRKNDVHYPFIIIQNGKAEVRISDNNLHVFNKNDIIYSDIYSVYDAFTFKALTSLTFMSLDQEMLNNIAFDNLDFRKALFELIEESQVQ